MYTHHNIVVGRVVLLLEEEERKKEEVMMKKRRLTHALPRLQHFHVGPSLQLPPKSYASLSNGIAVARCLLLASQGDIYCVLAHTRTQREKESAGTPVVLAVVRGNSFASLKPWGRLGKKA